MQHGYYAVYDNKAERYYSPMLFRSDLEALRVFNDCIEDPNHQFGKNPEDYSIWKIALWDEETGEIDKQKPTKPQAQPIKMEAAK